MIELVQLWFFHVLHTFATMPLLILSNLELLSTTVREIVFNFKLVHVTHAASAVLCAIFHFAPVDPNEDLNGIFGKCFV